MKVIWECIRVKWNSIPHYPSLSNENYLYLYRKCSDNTDWHYFKVSRLWAYSRHSYTVCNECCSPVSSAKLDYMVRIFIHIHIGTLYTYSLGNPSSILINISKLSRGTLYVFPMIYEVILRDIGNKYSQHHKYFNFVNISYCQ